MAVVVLSLNTAIDRTLVVPGLRLGHEFRASDAWAEAGGKALNVARVLRQLGDQVTVVGFLGGAAAPLIRDGCDRMGLDQHWVTTAGSSRTCLILLGDVETGPTVINEEGPRVTPAEVEELREELDRSVRSGDILCLSGSAPPGVPPGTLGEIVTSLGHRGVRVMLDTSGARLAEGLPARPWGVAPNVAEASAVLGPHEPPRLAASLAECAEHVLLTLGSEGAIYAGEGESWRLMPPPLTAINPIASGDALVAGFVWGMAHGRSGLESARLGVACGSANAAQLRAGVPSRARVEAMASEVTEEPIPTSR